MSLAIGKKGQNVRLAAKLTGWRIDIKSEEEKRREVEAQFEGLEAEAEAQAEGTDEEGGDDTPDLYALAGVGDRTVRKLVAAGFATAEAVAAATVEQLSEVPGVGKTAGKILAAARGESNSCEGDAGEPAERRRRVVGRILI